MVKIVIRTLVYLLIALLLVEVFKRLIMRMGFENEYVWVMRGSALQFTLLMGCLIGLFSWFLLRRFLHSRPLIISNVLIPILVLTAAEFSIKNLLDHPDKIPASSLDGFIYYYDHFDARLLQYEKGAMEYDSTLFYKFIPAAQIDFINREFEIQVKANKLGLRDSDAALESPEMIFIGDSHTMGWGVQQDQAFPALVGTLTGKKVLNAGIPSFGTARELKLLHLLDTSNLKHLIIQYCSNDVEENEKAIGNGGILEVSSKAAFDSVNNLYKGIRSYFPFKHLSVWGNRAIKLQLSHWVGKKSVPYGRNPPSMTADLQAAQFIKLLSNAPVDLSRVQITVLNFNHTGAMDSSFAVSLEHQMKTEEVRLKFPGSVNIVNVYRVLKPADLFILDPHMTAEGHAKVARELLRFIK